MKENELTGDESHGAASRGEAPASVDRRLLGDEWLDWSGDVTEVESEIEETPLLFLLFALGALIAYIGAALFFLYMVFPRLWGWHQGMAVGVCVVVVTVGCMAVLWFVGMVVSFFLSGRVPLGGVAKRLFPAFLTPLVFRTGRLLGISRDRLGHSFVRLNNIVTRDSLRMVKNVLVLLPRCLKKEQKDEIKAMASRYGIPVFTATGGEQARKIVAMHRPDGVIAVACERDLVSGMKDVRGISVIGIPNKRYNGPCYQTEVDLSEFEDALRFMAERGGERRE